ncbi:hypothetical protein EV361DRAFT_951281 [Lentinula raphanica]|uniref:T6SS Phospholipase effector Tle1-like catalytic domain-containing protein n=1 Tax=Lentinula raphanica TaxID=153919 RepID=A0AA38P628_9AGAR|nr:hypothetical protein F5878DRAFT_624362 [Lentinula raphanica]KAJ3969648.1 hypothetical protein EV361DRAFT_951281 [Lentinula raphanica]
MAQNDDKRDNQRDDLLTNLKRTPSSPPEYSHQVQRDDTRLPSAKRRLEDVIPKTHGHRTLVLCFDGTGDQFDEDNSNVVNLFSLLKKDDPSQQLVYYQSGIGTYTIPQIAQPWMAKLHRVADMMVGFHLDAHVMTGYEFLMQNYKAGDKICIFGFSRGAYTARALAGMIHKVGLLPRHNHQQVPFAYKMYSREDETGWRLSTAFKKSFCIDIDIDFLGLWDTVGSVGIIPKRLPFTSSNTSVRYFRHALSLDEHRARFVPSLWDHSLANRQYHKKHLSFNFGLPRGVMPKSNGLFRKQSHIGGIHAAQSGESHSAASVARADTTNNGPAMKTLRQLEQEFDAMNGFDPDIEEGQTPTDVEEVWFAGCHCDVGGGAVKNDTRNSLARIPLRWMIRECFKADTGIMFHRELLKQVGLDPDALWPHVKERPPLANLDEMHNDIASVSVHPSNTQRRNTLVEDFFSEEHEDIKDALSPINDMLKTDPGWWLLEIMPYKIKYQRTDRGNADEDETCSIHAQHQGDSGHSDRADDGGKWATKILWANLGRARHIPCKAQRGVKVHRTVKIRMDAEAGALVDDREKGKGKEKGKKYVPRPKWDFNPVWVD